MQSWKHRRLAPRVLRLPARHGELDPAPRSHTPTPEPAAEGFIDTYDALETPSTTADQELAKANENIEELGAKQISHSAPVAATNTTERFERTDHDETSKAPDDVITDSDAFLDMMKKQRENDPESLPMGQRTVDDVTAAIKSAKKKWAQADGIRAEYRALL